jgi:hypothetical protein
MEADARQYTQVELYLPRFDLKVPAARLGNTLYVPIVFFCEFLGIKRDTQVDMLKANPRFNADEQLREVPCKLKSGWRTPLSIRKPECALWLVDIESSRCKPEVRERLNELKVDFLAAADKVLWGLAPNAPEEERSAVHVTSRTEFFCQDCGAPHVIIEEGGQRRIEQAHK